MRTVLLITFLAFSLFSEPSYKFGLGYESGLSFRYFPSNFGVGIVVGPFGSSSARSLYFSQSINDSSDSYQYIRNVTDKGLIGTISGYYKVKLKMFSVTPYASVGYGYSRRYQQTQYNTSVSSQSIDFHAVIGEFGVLPGFSYKRISVEAKLGINARYQFSRIPENTDSNGINNRSSETEKSLNLIYPRDIVQGLIFHFWF